MARTVVVSGGFDPVHIGHLQLFKEARALGDRLVVVVNNDHWLRAKKGFVVMPEQERASLLQEFPYVDDVVLTGHSINPTDMSVCNELRTLRPDVFANGGDRFADNVPEARICQEIGIELAFNVGGGKAQSSSDMVRSAHAMRITTYRPWGFFKNHEHVQGAMIKTLHVLPGKRLSLQRHALRDELWILVEGQGTAIIGSTQDSLMRTELQTHVPFEIPRGIIHRLESETGCVVLEVTRGEFDEEDIERLEDDFGRVGQQS